MRRTSPPNTSPLRVVRVLTAVQHLCCWPSRVGIFNRRSRSTLNGAGLDWRALLIDREALSAANWQRNNAMEALPSPSGLRQAELFRPFDAGRFFCVANSAGREPAGAAGVGFLGETSLATERAFATFPPESVSGEPSK